MKVPRKYVVPRVIELGLAGGRPLGVNVYLIDGGSEYALWDIGSAEAVAEVIDLLRGMDFPLSRCSLLIASHADADHVQGLAAARDRLKAKTAAHPAAADALEAGDPIGTFASIPALGFHMDMPACKVDVRLNEGDRLAIGDLTATVWHTPGHTAGQIALKIGDVLFSGDNIFRDGCVGVIAAHHGSRIPDFIRSLERIRDDDAQFLLPSHGPPFRNDPAVLQAAIDRLGRYQHMADFGACAVGWPLQDQWEKDVMAGRAPEL